MRIETGNTAISRGGRLSKPVNLLIENNLLTEAMGFFDWGHGLGEDMLALRAKGHRFVAGWDPNFYVQGFSLEETPEATTQAFRNTFEWIHCGYVLNVLPDPGQRDSTLKRIKKFMLDGRQLCVAVRTKKEVSYNVNGLWKTYNDGWFTPKKTFQKGFEVNELIDLLARHGFTNLNILSKNPLVATSRKPDKIQQENAESEWTEAFLDNFEE
jgi:DNA phosphorothioation-associated putative methyltransferase